MGFGDFLNDLAGAAVAPFTATVSSVKSALKGDIAGSLKSQVAGLGATLKPVGTYTAEFGKGFANAGKGIASGVGSLGRGDLKGAGQGAARFAVSGTNIAVAENTAGLSPTGYGAISRGSTSSADYKRAALTTAALATAGAAAPSASGGVLTGTGGAQYAAGLSALATGNYAGAVGSIGGAGLGNLVPEGLQNGIDSVKPFLPLAGGLLPSDAKSSYNAVAGVPESSGGPVSALPVLLVAVGGFVIWKFARKK